MVEYKVGKKTKRGVSVMWLYRFRRGGLWFLVLLGWGMVFPSASFSTTSGGADSVLPQSQKALEEIKGFATMKKQEWEEALQRQFTELNRRIDQLHTQGKDLGNQAQHHFQTQLENLRKKKDDLLPQLDKLRHSSRTAWETLREGIIEALSDLQQSVNQAAQAFE